MANKNEIRNIIRLAESQGWIINKTKGGHLRWTAPAGGFVFTASTPSDNRATQNMIRDLRKYGLTVDKK